MDSISRIMVRTWRLRKNVVIQHGCLGGFRFGTVGHGTMGTFSLAFSRRSVRRTASMLVSFLLFCTFNTHAQEQSTRESEEVGGIL
jgi:hypothetical protein